MSKVAAHHMTNCDDDDCDKEAEERGVERSGEGIVEYQLEGILCYTDGYCGGISYKEITQTLDMLANDRTVTGVLLCIDSPGGMVQGLAETEQALKKLIAAKPVIVLADQLASGAYWLGCHADKIYMTDPYAFSGSVGVVRIHFDYSKQLEQDGVGVQVIASGDRKLSGSTLFPLTEQEMSEGRSESLEIYANFKNSVAQARGLDLNNADNTLEAAGNVIKFGWASGNLFNASQAQSHGLIDGVSSKAAAIAELSLLVRERQQVALDTMPVVNNNVKLRINYVN